MSKKSSVAVIVKGKPDPKKAGRKKKVLGKYGDHQVPYPLYNQETVYKIKRVVDGSGSLTQTTLTPLLGALSFKLNLLDNYTEFTALFDMYKIDYIEVKFIPQFNMQTITTNSTITPNLYTVLDYDDATAPASISELRQFSTFREDRFDYVVTRAIQPRMAVAAYSGAFTSYANTRSWVDCNSPGIEWYGVKYGASAGASGQTNLQTWSYVVSYYISFKHVR
jgi:hypothetical protein